MDGTQQTGQIQDEEEDLDIGPMCLCVCVFRECTHMNRYRGRREVGAGPID